MTTSRLTNTNAGSVMQHNDEEEQSQKSITVNSEVHFETLQAKRRMQATPDSYLVKFRITVVLGIPIMKKKGTITTITEENSEVESIAAAVKVNSHYHVEYSLTPQEEVIRTDVLLLTINVAKIYPERGDAKYVKTWVNNDVVWVAWSHTHGVHMTIDRLVQFYSHKIEMRVWDTRDACTTRAKFERPRSVKAKPEPSSQSEYGDVRAYVFGHSNKYRMGIPKPGIPSRPLPSQSYGSEVESNGGLMPPATVATTQALLDDATTFRGRTSMTGSFSKAEGLENAGATGRRASRASMISGQGDKGAARQDSRPASRVPSIEMIEEEVTVKNPEPPAKADLGVTMRSEMTNQTRMTRAQISALKKAQKAAEERDAETVRKVGRCSMAVESLLFFSNIKAHTVRLESPVYTISDAFFTVELETPLFDQDVAPRLNPLTIQIVSCTSLPNHPISQHELATKCNPVYCKYKFLGQPVHQTAGARHGKKVYWNDVKVILAGFLDPVQLREYFATHPLEIELHDRDKLVTGRVEGPPALFGVEADDPQLNSATYISSKRIVLNDESERQPDPYGVARIDLSCLLKDLTSVTFNVPVVPANAPNVIQHPQTGVNGDHLSNVVLIGENGTGPIQPGDYVGAQTTLKVTVNLVTQVPNVGPGLNPTPTVTSTPTQHVVPAVCPFSRVVFIFETGYPSVPTGNPRSAAQNTSSLDHLIEKLLSTVREVNVKALGLVERYDGQRNLIESALETYKLDDEQKSSKTLDVLTGLLITDNKRTVVLLEGLRDYGVTAVLQAVPKPAGEKRMTVLYNTEYPFSSRLYGQFDCVPPRIRLLSTFDKILEQPLVFVRHMIPSLCIDALRKLSVLVHTDNLQDAVRNDLLPSGEQILVLNQEFGVPFEKRLRPRTLTPASLRERSKMDDLADDLESDSQNESFSRQKMATRSTNGILSEPQAHRSKRSESPIRSAPLENRNDVYEQMLRERSGSPQQRDFVRSNQRFISTLSRASSEKRMAAEHRRSHTSLTGTSMFRIDTPLAYNYSGQKLSSVELAKAELRKIMQQYPNRQFAYSREYMSGSFEPVDPQETILAETAKERAKWKTEKGFIYPGSTTSMSDNAHSKRPDPARIDALRDQWTENELWTAKLKPTLEHRDHFDWEHRDTDMNLWRQTHKTSFGDEPISMFISSVSPDGQIVGEFAETHAGELLRSFSGTTWLRLHRRGPHTELAERGRESSNQVDKLAGLLKDRPQKLGLKVRRLQQMPPIAVVTLQTDAERELDFQHARAHSRGSSPERNVPAYSPGPYDKRTLALNENVIPRQQYGHDYFSQLKGQDFVSNVQVRPSMIYKGPDVADKGKDVLPSGLHKPLVSPPSTRLAE